MADQNATASAAAATRVVIHVDDVGMNHGANQAFIELSRFGTVTAGSVMVPCPWFSEIAEAAAATPDLDCGVHLTLNSEMDYYRWAPITRPTQASGLLDDHGYMWPDVATLRRNAHPDAVEAEWRAQIDRALAAGIDVTHLDTHMYSAMAPEWCERYVAVGIDYGVPVLISAALSEYGPRNDLSDNTDTPYARASAIAAAAGMPVFDRVFETDFCRLRHEPVDYRAMLSKVAGRTGGLVYCAFHPTVPGGAEIEVIEPDQFHVRTDEYELFGTIEWRDWLNSQPFTLTTMRELRAFWHSKVA